MTEIKNSGTSGPGRAALALMAMLALLLLPAGCQRAGDGVGLSATGERLTFCQQYPEDTICKPPVDPCIANPKLSGCPDSCETVPPAPGCSVVVVPTKVKFEQILPILLNPTSNCDKCHLPGGLGAMQGKLLLTADSAYSNLVDARVATAMYANKGWVRVKPGLPDSSWFFLKISMAAPKLPEGTSIGQRMPQGYAPLDTGSINLIRQWILDGAIK